MGDFLLDLRHPAQRHSFKRASSFLLFQEHLKSEVFEWPDFSLLLTSVDSPAIWAPYSGPDLFVALCGRIDLCEKDWQEAESLPDAGGLAAKAIAREYRLRGEPALEDLSGNFAVILWDRTKKLLFIVTDLCGAQPVFKSNRQASPGFSSHPDALAICMDEEFNWDETSLRQFLYTSSVTPPHTYYKHIKSVRCGTILTVDFKEKACPVIERTYFELHYAGSPTASERDLAEELAAAITSSVRKRTSGRFGPVAIALSGGLDSRTVLAATDDRDNLFAFSCLDEENLEFQSARSVASVLGVKLVPLTRTFDYYADNAELGIRIAGGMGTFANNHFLGIYRQLRDLGTQSFLTGCYFDYLFKALPLNTRTGIFLRAERLSGYSHQFYFDHYRLNQAAAAAVVERLEARFPARLRNSTDPADVFELEKLRTFPLFQEPDNAQRLIPQRVLHSYLPVSDREILNVYSKIPYHFKLNRSLFKKAVAIICGPELSRIPDANTGAPANAGVLRESFSAAALRLRSRIRKIKPALSTNGSWPDWNYYVQHSQKLRDLWNRPCPSALDFFHKALPPQDIRDTPADYSGKDLFLFIQMLSIKLWLSQRCSSVS